MSSGDSWGKRSLCFTWLWLLRIKFISSWLFIPVRFYQLDILNLEGFREKRKKVGKCWKHFSFHWIISMSHMQICIFKEIKNLRTYHNKIAVLLLLNSLSIFPLKIIIIICSPKPLSYINLYQCYLWIVLQPPIVQMSLFN